MLPLTRPKFHYDWHWQWPYGNGDLGNQGIHQMDIARWGLGVDELEQTRDQLRRPAGLRRRRRDGQHRRSSSTTSATRRWSSRSAAWRPTRCKGANVGVIFYGTEGYVVLTSYTSGAAFDPDGKLVKKFNGGGDHFGNFIKAVRSRKHRRPARRHPGRPPLQRPVPHGQHLLPAWRAAVGGRPQEAARQREVPATTWWTPSNARRPTWRPTR